MKGGCQGSKIKIKSEEVMSSFSFGVKLSIPIALAIGCAALFIISGAQAAKSYPYYGVQPDGAYYTVVKQESAEHEYSEVPASELRRLSRKNGRMRDLVNSYEAEGYGTSRRLNWEEARELAKNLKRKAVSRGERYNDELRCKARGKTYYISNHGRHASMRVANRAGDFLIFEGAESEKGGAISLRKSVKNSNCSLEFTHNARGLHGFRVCLGEGETYGTLSVNSKTVNVTCDRNGSFHDNVADSVESGRRHGRKKYARHGRKSRNWKRSAHHRRGHGSGDTDEDEAEENEIDWSVDPEPTRILN
jgi:hypothetical protein